MAGEIQKEVYELSLYESRIFNPSGRIRFQFIKLDAIEKTKNIAPRTIRTSSISSVNILNLYANADAIIRTIPIKNRGYLYLSGNFILYHLQYPEIYWPTS